MAGSFQYFKSEIKEYLKRQYKGDIKILDVGAGSGTYFNLLSDYFTNMEAVEIFKPNIDKYELDKKYTRVYNADIRDFKYDYYDLIIFGDVIEHLEVEEAQKVLEYAKDRCQNMVVSVPYEYPQDEFEGNLYEIHKQADLTPRNVLERYPYLELLYGNNEYGYYILRKGEQKDV